VGGGFRFVLRSPDGKAMGMRGVYRELAPPDRSIYMESFDDYPGESMVTGVHVEQEGAAESYDKLAELLAASQTRTMEGGAGEA
jgi:uncharacterized protein YndB with AHSA1/START domain